MTPWQEEIILKIYEKTHEKVSEDDPILTVLIAQQLIVDEFTENLENAISIAEKRVSDLYINSQKNLFF